MKQFIRLVSVLLILGSAPCRAENDTIVHNFQTLYSAGNLTITANGASEARKIGTVNDGIVYTCGDNVEFNNDIATSTQKAINFYGSIKRVVTTQINDLKEIRMKNSLSNGARTLDLRIKLSTDGSSWGDAISMVAVPATNLCSATFPKGNYYVRIYTYGSIEVSITELRFVTESEDCNCFVYTP